MARILEDDALKLLHDACVAVPRIETVDTAAGAAQALERLGGKAVLKALIPTGGRGKAGGVKIARDKTQALQYAENLLGSTIANFPVTALLISELVDVEKEYFVSFAFDSVARRPVLLFCAAGGVDIEQILQENPEALIRKTISLTNGLRPFEAREIAIAGGLTGKTMLAVADCLCALWCLFVELKAETLEVNPLVLTSNESIVAPTAAIVLDDQIRLKNLDIGQAIDRYRTNGWRPLTDLELQMRAIDQTDLSSSIRFNEFPDGNIALMVSGGGTGMIALDALYRVGGKPACTFDITPGRIEEKTYLATKAVVSQGNVRGLLAGSPYVNFIPIDIKVRGTIRALKELRTDTRRFPVVFRFDGPNLEEGKRVAAEVEGIEFYDSATPIEHAVFRIAERVGAL